MQSAVPPNSPHVLTAERLKPLLQRADNGDETVVPELRAALKEVPQLAGAMGGNLAEEAERALVKAIAGKDLIYREGVYQQMSNLRLELSGPNPMPLERLLVERVVLCWLHAYHADCQYAYAKSVTLEHGEYLQRQQDRAQRRYLAAIKSLATVRRLALPIKVDVSVVGTVESRTNGTTCRRPVDVVQAGQLQRS